MIINTLKFRSNLYLSVVMFLMTTVFFVLCSEYLSFIVQINKWQEAKKNYLAHMCKVKQMCRVQRSMVVKHLVHNQPENSHELESSLHPTIKQNEPKAVTVVEQKESAKKNVQSLPIKKKEIDFMWPVEKDKFWLSSYFGLRKLPNGQRQFHNGIDMAALKGTHVRAAASGTVELSNEDPLGYGKTIIIKHNKKFKTRYAHLNNMFVSKGQKVEQGQLIGHVGSTGNVRKTGRDASHLHFEVYAHEERIDPLTFFR